MLTAFTNDATTWLGYLQRGSVLIQLALFVVAVAAETRLKRRLQSPLLSSASYLVTPLLVLVVSCSGWLCASRPDCCATSRFC